MRRKSKKYEAKIAWLIGAICCAMLLIAGAATDAIAQSAGGNAGGGLSGLDAEEFANPDEPIRTGYQLDGSSFTDFSFNDLGAVDAPGSISGNFNEQAGYNLERTWEAGDSLSDVIRLGDISSDFAAETTDLNQLEQVLGEDLGQRSLGEFGPLVDSDLNTLSQSVPFLSEVQVGDAPPIEALANQAGITTGEDFQQIGGLLSENPELGELNLADLDSLDEFSISDLPGAEATRLDSLDNWEEASISDIPGLGDLPFNEFPSGIGNIGGALARIDFVYGPAETDRNHTISGSYQVGFNAACPDEGRLTGFDPPVNEPEANPPECAYLELDDPVDDPSIEGALHGAQWISGKYHEVEGGFGPLRSVPSPLGFSTGYEPTGRHPFGSAFKVVVWEPDERSDEVSFRLLFRWCTTIFGVGRTCTPYNQFAIPFVSHSVNDVIFVGALDGEGGSAASGGDQQDGLEEAGFNVPGAPGSPTGCSGEVIGGIDTGSLADSIAEIESEGSGGYSAVGPPTCADGGTNCGRGLGRYQTMSYLPTVQESISQRPGGTEFLSRVESGYRPTEAEMEEFYPPEAQEAVYQQEINMQLEGAQQEIDPRTGEPFEGSRLIERTAQRWFAGPNSTIDAGSSDRLGRLTTYDYGVEARQSYLARGGQPSTECAAISAGEKGEAGTATGDFINPAPGYEITSPFGPRNIGCAYSKFHPAVDLATPIGTPIQAADGGVVQLASCGVGGYGCTVVIDHGDGTKTHYAHLREGSFNVREGEAVAQGQEIAEGGNTGRSTGPHLDFAIYENDPSGAGALPDSQNAIDPESVINF